MAASADANDVAVVSARLHRLVQRYPETPNVVFIVVMIIGFLLIVPIVLLAGALCVYAKVNVVLGFVGGVVLWLGVFMFLRQLLLWRRVQKVNAFVRAFNREFSDEGLRETALACLREVDGESNEVAAQVQARLGATGRTGRRALRSGQVLHAGQGLAPAADPVIDRQVEELLRPLNGKLRMKSAIHWLVGLGLPIAFFVLGCIFEPEADGISLLWTTVVVMVVWNIVFTMIVSFVEVSFIVGPATRSFQARFPKGSSERDIAMAAFSRITGCEKAKAALRSDLRMEESDDDEAVFDGERPPARRERPPAPEPVRPAPVSQFPALDPLPAAAPAPVSGQRAAGHAAIPLEPVGGTRREIQVPPPAPGQAIPLQASASPAPPSAPAFCTQCGKRKREEDRFCTGCGKKLF